MSSNRTAWVGNSHVTQALGIHTVTLTRGMAKLKSSQQVVEAERMHACWDEASLAHGAPSPAIAILNLCSPGPFNRDLVNAVTPHIELTSVHRDVVTSGGFAVPSPAPAPQGATCAVVGYPGRPSWEEYQHSQSTAFGVLSHRDVCTVELEALDIRIHIHVLRCSCNVGRLCTSFSVVHVVC